MNDKRGTDDKGGKGGKGGSGDKGAGTVGTGNKGGRGGGVKAKTNKPASELLKARKRARTERIKQAKRDACGNL